MMHSAFITRRVLSAFLVSGTLLLTPGCGKAPAARASEPAPDRPSSSYASSGSGATVPTPSDAAEFVLPSDAVGVTAAAVRLEPLPDYLEITAHVEADPTRVVHVYGPVSGRLISVAVRPADFVRQGQTLAVLASSDVAAARSAYQQALADNEVKKKSLDRAQELFEHRAIAQKDYQQAVADATMSAAALESARERLTLLDVDPAGSSDQIRVMAPRSGVVLDIGAAAGEYSKSLDNSAPLATLADLSTVWALGDVYEKDLASVRLGEPADVAMNAYPGEAWHGRTAATTAEAIQQGALLEMRPVMLACFAAGLGLLPAAISTGIGAQAQQPLARVVVGAMLTTIVAILFLVPAFATFSREAVVVPEPRD